MSESDSSDEERQNDRDLAGALAARNISLPADRVALLDRYRALLWSWNEQLNLTRHTTIAKFVDRDVVDSLQLVEFIRQHERVLDVGAGGGVPGIVIAICRPDLRVAVCDSTQKKARVLQTIIDDLGLPVEAFGCRAEELLVIRTFDTLVARAVAPLAKLLYWLQPHWNAMEQLLLIKGRNWVDERNDARHRGLLKELELRKLATYTSAALPGESVVLRIRPKVEDS